MEMFLKMVAPVLTFAAPVLVRLSKLQPYFNLTNKDGSPYMDRNWLVKPSKWTKGWGVRIHEIRSSDDDRALHDHPWEFYSLILKNGYREIVAAFETYQAAADFYYRDGDALLWDGFMLGWEPQTDKWIVYRKLRRGQVNANHPGTWHRLRLDTEGGVDVPATTLFICGPRTVGWGFLVDGDKVPWREYLAGEFGAEHVTATEKKLEQAFGTSRVSK